MWSVILRLIFWNSRNLIVSNCHRPKSTSITATIAQKSSDTVELLDDGQQSTAWKVALMWLLSSVAVVLLSSDAQPSQIIDIRPKFKIWYSPKMMPSRSIWLKMGTKPVWDTLYNFGYFAPATLLGRLMCLRDVFGVGKWIILLWLCEFSRSVLALGWVQQSAGVE